MTTRASKIPLSRIAGVVYPDVLQVDDYIHPMLDTMEKGLENVRDIVTVKNTQLGIIGNTLSYNEKQTLVLGLDGLLDNGESLAKEIKKNGITPASTQSGLCLQAYELFGEDFLQKIDGSFALFVHDVTKSRLILARDRIGKQPLYWYHDQHHFIFASELKALIATGIVPQTFSRDAIAMYLYFGYIPQDLSPIKEVNKLLPGNYLVFDAHKGKKICPYWSYSSYYEKRENSDPKIVTENIEKLLYESTKALIPPDEDSGCFLSGGIGSATVAYEVSKLSKPKGFSVYFKDQNESDFEAVKSVASTLKIPLKSASITAKNFVDHLVEIIWALDEPLADPNIVATYSLAALAKDETYAVFSGMGSDEFLAGHNRYTTDEQNLAMMSRLNLIPAPIIKHVLIPIAHAIYKPAAYNILKISRTNPWQFEFLRQGALFDEGSLRDASPKLAALFDPDTFLHKFHHISRIRSTVSSLLYFDVKTRLPDCFILQFERLTKICGLSWRTPFLNRHLIEYAAGLPEPEILAEAETASYLKPLISSIFPEQFINRPKRTRHNFLNLWANEPEIHMLFQFLLNGALVENGIICKKWIQQALKDSQMIQENFHRLFGLLVLEIWFHLYINRPLHQEPTTTNINELLISS